MQRQIDSVTGGLHIFALCSFAIAQPLFDLLSRNPEFFVARGSQPLDVVLLALTLCVLVPALLVVLVGASRLLGLRMHATLHALVVFLLIAVTALPALKRIHGLSGTLLIAIAMGIGIVATTTYFRFSAPRTFLTMLSPAILLFPALFLFHSPVAKVLRAGGHVEEHLPKVGATAPVVVVIFDEFSVTSLMDDHGQIDAIRYPNFAAVGRDATWFRNATTVSDNTLTAVPAMLTGSYPDEKPAIMFGEGRLPTAADYPHNLFTLLGGSYDMQVFERLTALCPKAICGPGPHDRSAVQRIRSMFVDLGVVYLHIVLPPDFATRLPVVTRSWADFGMADNRTFSAPPVLFSRFLESITPAGEKPGLYFLHVLLPHVPWTYLPSGRSYLVAADNIEGLHEEQWTEDEWPVALAYQRYLLQVGFVDKLVGDLIAKLKAVDLYDRSLIVLMADHGVSFRSGSSRRVASETNLEEIMAIPLLIKAPGQHHGEIDDRNVQSVDILPTISDILGIKLPWSVDGHSALAKTRPPDSEKVIFAHDTALKFVVGAKVAFEAMHAALRRKIALFGSGSNGGLHKMGSHGDLVGRRISEVEVTGDQLDVELAQPDLLANVDPNADFVPAQIAGRIGATGHTTPHLDLAIAVNDVIQATTRTYQVDGDELAFSAVVPEESFHRGSNEVEVFVVSADKGRVTLAPTKTGAVTWHSAPSSIQSNGDNEVIQSASGAAVPILSLLGGWLEIAKMSTDTLQLSGWAADTESGQSAETVAVFANGRRVYSGPTTLVRRDVVRAYRAPQLERSGFRFAVPRSLFRDGSQSEVRIFALSRRRVAFELHYPDGYPFRQPPAPPPRMAPPSYSDEGFFDTADCQVIAGWARDTRRPQVPATVDIFDGEMLLATVAADQFRRDLADAGYGDGRHGFTYAVPASLKDGKPHAIRVTVAGTQVELEERAQLPRRPKTITCLSSEVARNYEGLIEATDCNAIAGWAWDRSRPNQPINVDVYDDDVLLGRVSADQFRQDLADAGKGDGAHAFVYTPPTGVKDGRPHSISVKISEGDMRLSDTPKLMQCQR